MTDHLRQAALDRFWAKYSELIEGNLSDVLVELENDRRDLLSCHAYPWDVDFKVRLRVTEIVPIERDGT